MNLTIAGSQSKQQRPGAPATEANSFRPVKAFASDGMAPRGNGKKS